MCADVEKRDGIQTQVISLSRFCALGVHRLPDGGLCACLLPGGDLWCPILRLLEPGAGLGAECAAPGVAEPAYRSHCSDKDSR